MILIFVSQVHREIKKAPSEFLYHSYSLLEELLSGKTLGMPISRPLYSLSKGLHELRLSGRSGEFRVFYLIKRGNIYVLHACLKKTEKIDIKTRNLILARIQRL